MDDGFSNVRSRIISRRVVLLVVNRESLWLCPAEKFSATGTEQRLLQYEHLKRVLPGWEWIGNPEHVTVSTAMGKIETITAYLPSPE